MEQYIPDIYQETIYDIDYKKLKKSGIKCILFDLDNTMVSRKSSKPSWKLKKFIKELKDDGFKIILFTNGSSKKRVEPFKNGLDLDCHLNKIKPKLSSYDMLMQYYKYSVDQILVIGDQLIADILCGNKVGVTTALVDKIDNTDSFINFYNRAVEYILFRSMTKKDLFRKKSYYQ